MSARIDGIGIVCAAGRGLDALERAVREGGSRPTLRPVPGREEPMKVLCVPDECLQGGHAKGMRRADRPSRMAVAAAWDAWRDAGPPEVDPARTGLVVATALGPHVRTFAFLDGILDFGDEAVSPTAFSHSVHNAAASYVASALKIHGPVLTLTDFRVAFQQALTMADCWLAAGRCERVLVGAVEELGDVMLHVWDRMIGAGPPEAVPGEGAVFFVLSTPGSDGGRGVVIETDGLWEAGAAQPAPSAAAAACGSMLTGSAFHCAASALSLRGEPGGGPRTLRPQAVSCAPPGAHADCRHTTLRQRGGDQR